ncbi:MAG: hypothetical protein F7B17_08385 [Desulfurococcales archaeon]|nr:hypothetical protein [Desulfurococcales archaeon]
MAPLTVTIELVGRSRKFSDDVSGVAWSPDGSRLAVATSSKIYVYEASGGGLTLARKINPHRGSIYGPS